MLRELIIHASTTLIHMCFDYNVKLISSKDQIFSYIWFEYNPEIIASYLNGRKHNMTW